MYVVCIGEVTVLIMIIYNILKSDIPCLKFLISFSSTDQFQEMGKCHAYIYLLKIL